MIDITSREKKNRMNPNALATIFSLCLVSEDKEISENSAATLALQMAMVRTREHQFAVRDFLVKCMEWRSNSKKPVPSLRRVVKWMTTATIRTRTVVLNSSPRVRSVRT